MAPGKAVLIVAIVIIAALAVLGIVLLSNHSQKSAKTTTIPTSYSSTIVIIVNRSSTASSTATTSIASTTVPVNSTNQSNVSQQSNFTNYIYCVGTATQDSNSTYYAPISNAGIGGWNQTTDYPVPIFADGCSISNGYIYCVGSPGLGVNETTNVSVKLAYYTGISSSGLNAWAPTTSYPQLLLDGGCSTANNYIYCVGGGNYSDPRYAYYAPVSSYGIGEWKETTPYPMGLFDAGCVIYSGEIYCTGTEYVNLTTNSINLTSLGDVYYAPVSDSGIGNWIKTTNYPIPFFGAGCSAYNSTIYCVGDGYPNTTFSHSAYYAPILGSGGLGSWKRTTDYPISFSYAGCVLSNGYLYCVGSYNTTNHNEAYYAPVSSKGIGNWNQTTSYPTALFDAYCSTNGDSGGFYSS